MQTAQNKKVSLKHRFLTIFRKRVPIPLSSGDFLNNPKVIHKAQQKQQKSGEQAAAIISILPQINKHKGKIILIITYLAVTSLAFHIYLLYTLILK